MPAKENTAKVTVAMSAAQAATTISTPGKAERKPVVNRSSAVKESEPLSPHDVGIAQALADIATIGILHERVLSHSAVLTAQLQTALNTRLVIEQAKGVLAERGSIDMDEAFTSLRAHARDTRRRLAELARAVVDGGEADAVLRRT